MILFVARDPISGGVLRHRWFIDEVIPAIAVILHTRRMSGSELYRLPPEKIRCIFAA